MLKREHKLNLIQKHGILKAKEECLLACIAANLKRMAKVIHVFLFYVALAARIRNDSFVNPEKIRAVSLLA
jgi:hypothetical protein